MRIGIDVRYLSHGLVGGVHTYVAQFVPALVELASDHQLFLYADTKCAFELTALPDYVTTRYLPWKSGLSSLFNDLFMRRVIARDNLDIMHYPANYGFAPPGVPTIITLHDAINILPLHEIIRGHPKKLRTMAMMTYLHICTRLAVREADLLLTVSDYAGQEIARHVRFDRARIVPVPHAPTPDLRRIEDAAELARIRDTHDLPQSFILADALKNPAVLIHAWRKLPAHLREGREIVFFSRRPDPLPIVHEAVAQREARLLVRPSRADLIGLYSMADAFVFPSWTEGFGIPLLEAMTCGAPIIASDRGAIPEVVGDAGLIGDAEDAAQMAHHLASVLDNASETRRLRERGLARAAQFSWQETARRILQTYQQVQPCVS